MDASNQMEEKHEGFNDQDLQLQSKTPVSTENLNSCCYSCPTVSIPDDTLTRLSDINLCKEKGTPDAAQKMPNHPWLATLPPEIILVIFSYLDARFTLKVLTRVCKLFYKLLSPESSWKTRFGKQWPNRDNREDYDYVSRFVFFFCLIP